MHKEKYSHIIFLFNSFQSNSNLEQVCTMHMVCFLDKVNFELDLYLDLVCFLDIIKMCQAHRCLILKKSLFHCYGQTAMHKVAIIIQKWPHSFETNHDFRTIFPEYKTIFVYKYVLYRTKGKIFLDTQVGPSVGPSHFRISNLW